MNTIEWTWYHFPTADWEGFNRPPLTTISLIHLLLWCPRHYNQLLGGSSLTSPVAAHGSWSFWIFIPRLQFRFFGRDLLLVEAAFDLQDLGLSLRHILCPRPFYGLLTSRFPLAGIMRYFRFVTFIQLVPAERDIDFSFLIFMGCLFAFSLLFHFVFQQAHHSSCRGFSFSCDLPNFGTEVKSSVISNICGPWILSPPVAHEGRIAGG